MTQESRHDVRRDPLVEQAVPMVAKALLISDDAEGLWEYFRVRVESEHHRIEENAIREALEPLEDRFSIAAVARVATIMAEQRAAGAYE